MPKNSENSKMKKMIEGVATTYFVMQNLFTVQKKKHLHEEHGLDVFKINCKLLNSFCIILCFRNLNIIRYQFFSFQSRVGR